VLAALVVSLRSELAQARAELERHGSGSLSLRPGCGRRRGTPPSRRRAKAGQAGAAVVDSAGKDVTGTHSRTDIMSTLFDSPWKVPVVATVLVVAIALIALFGSKKLPDNVPTGRPEQV
jgi:hypothetical protein